MELKSVNADKTPFAFKLLIAPYGIEISMLLALTSTGQTTNRTLWN